MQQFSIVPHDLPVYLVGRDSLADRDQADDAPAEPLHVNVLRFDDGLDGRLFQIERVT